jgi:hypothetical protein
MSGVRAAAHAAAAAAAAGSAGQARRSDTVKQAIEACKRLGKKAPTLDNYCLYWPREDDDERHGVFLEPERTLAHYPELTSVRASLTYTHRHTHRERGTNTHTHTPRPSRGWAERYTRIRGRSSSFACAGARRTCL